MRPASTLNNVHLETAQQTSCSLQTTLGNRIKAFETKPWGFQVFSPKSAKEMSDSENLLFLSLQNSECDTMFSLDLPAESEGQPW